jgi:hypothetical protein
VARTGRGFRRGHGRRRLSGRRPGTFRGDRRPGVPEVRLVHLIGLLDHLGVEQRRGPLGRPLSTGVLGRREARGRLVGEREQLRGELAGVFDDAQALGPDSVCLGIEVLDLPLTGGRDLRGLLASHDKPVFGLSPRLRRDLLGGLVRALEKPRDLLPDALERPSHRSFG